VEPRISVEQCCLAVEKIVGHKIVSASTDLFLNSVEKANYAVQSGVVLNGSLVPVLPLCSPSKKIILSNLLPFIKHVVLAKSYLVMENWFPLSRKSLLGVSHHW